MNAHHENNTALAVLIDADNTSPSIVEGLLTEVAMIGVANVKRIYGDWTTPNLTSWKQTLLKYSIQPIQQFRYTVGKNATDSAMIIDAMDLLYQGHFRGFCLVSSDSDFTRLAARIRESGCRVYGFGEMKTPRPFVAACDRFTYTEVFTQPTEAPSTSEVKPIITKTLDLDIELITTFREAIEAVSDEAGWAALSGVGSMVMKTANDFDPRNYGFKKLSDLIHATGLFDVERRGTLIYVRNGHK